MIRGLEDTFAPLTVAKWQDEQLQEIAAEPSTISSQRDFLVERIAKLKSGHEILRKVMRNAPI
jgi:hypothetical protein